MKNIEFKGLEKIKSEKATHVIQDTPLDSLFLFPGSKDICIYKGSWDGHLALNMRTGDWIEFIPDDTSIILLDVKYTIEIIEEY